MESVGEPFTQTEVDDLLKDFSMTTGSSNAVVKTGDQTSKGINYREFLEMITQK